MRKIVLLLLGFFLFMPLFADGLIDYVKISKDGSLSSNGKGQISGKLEIPGRINGINVSEIDGKAFYNWDGITSLIIPDTVKEIEEEAFKFCYNLRSADLGKNVTKIEDNAFYGCDSLTEVRLPSTLKSIGYGAFQSCESLNDIYFDGTVSKWNSIKLKNGWYTDNDSPLTIHCIDGNIVLDD